MIIDCHGHFTTAPPAHENWRADQLKAWGGGTAAPAYPKISDDALQATLEANQLRLMRERGIDLTLLSPRASTMAPHRGDELTNLAWTVACNDLIKRVVDLYPEEFAGVCQLPQSLGTPVQRSLEELRRCVLDLGFVGCNVNPDPSGGGWASAPMTDRSWYPLYEELTALDIPAMVHVSASGNQSFHTTGCYYLNADTTVFMQLLAGNLFADFPTLRLVIPHGGGAVPYHWGRFRGLADMLGRPEPAQHLMRNIFFDTCVYHQAGIDLLFEVIDSSSILFGSEMVGAVRGIDARTGYAFDDTRRYLDALGLDAAAAESVFAGNARRVYPRLDARLRGRGR